MTFTVFTKPRANSEIKDAVNWYEKQQIGLGLRFLDELEKVFTYLETSPLAFQKKYNEVREVPINVFPFVVLYEVEETVVTVYAVFHTNQHPEKKS
ncbi:MAG: type II toxin-antitoxin system RelE/ParE family toxin [Flavobacteriales bacterium]